MGLATTKHIVNLDTDDDGEEKDEMEDLMTDAEREAARQSEIQIEFEIAQRIAQDSVLNQTREIMEYVRHDRGYHCLVLVLSYWYELLMRAALLFCEVKSHRRSAK